MGVENDSFWSEKGSGFGGPADPHQEFPPSPSPPPPYESTGRPLLEYSDKMCTYFK